MQNPLAVLVYYLCGGLFFYSENFCDVAVDSLYQKNGVVFSA